MQEWSRTHMFFLARWVNKKILLALDKHYRLDYRERRAVVRTLLQLSSTLGATIYSYFWNLQKLLFFITQLCGDVKSHTAASCPSAVRMSEVCPSLHAIGKSRNFFEWVPVDNAVPEGPLEEVLDPRPDAPVAAAVDHHGQVLRGWGVD